MMQNVRKKISILLLVIGFLWAALPLQAKVSVEEAERLKKDLTPTGAERAGNADGTIPAWEGGLTAIPDNVQYDPASGGTFPDPFADDEILFTITAENMGEYADKLSDGVKEMFKKYPETWKMHVYPSRRTFAAPQWVYDNTYQNALTFELTEDKNGARGGYAGVPFPIPKHGAEVVFNHQCRWSGGDHGELTRCWLVHANGSKTVGGGAYYTFDVPYYDKDGSLETWSGWLSGVLIEYFEPARRKGEIILSIAPLDYTRIADKGNWQYMPGQRRVRRAPSIAYDTPNPSYGGLATYDDAYMFNSQIDRFDWKLLGKKEIFIGYNSYQIDLAPVDDLLTPYHWNPEYFRWELHRTWVVEATLKEGKRHCYGKRVLYMDEDSWNNSLHDKYDTRGNLWRMHMNAQYANYAMPCWVQRCYALYDFQTDSYATSGMLNGYEDQGKVLWWEDVPPDVLTPENVRKIGKR
ncbi:MAG: DUF1329 domain-containing protein [Desulfobacterales bacterium]